MQEMWEREHQKIKKIIPKTNGIFSHMNYTFRDEISKSGLDLMFFSNYGLRSPSPIVETIQETPGSQLTSAELDVLAALILEMYKVKWDKLGEVYDIEYDPIHNYLDQWEDENNGTRNQSNTDSSTRTDSFGHVISDDNLRTNALTETVTYGRTDTRTDNLTEAEDSRITNTGSGSNANNLYGFNSVNAVGHDTGSNSTSNTEVVDRDVVNTGTQATVSSGSDATANTGTQKDERDVVNSGSDSRSFTETASEAEADHREREGRHYGNIGNLTSQKQILEEINLWRWNYMNEILNDVKEFCTLPLYKCN